MIRPLLNKDIPCLKQIHAESGFAWKFPRLETLMAAQVVTNERDEPVMLLAARPMAEIIGIFDPAYENPATRLAALDAVSRALEDDLRRLGIRETVAWLPQEIAKTFSRRLRRHFHWVENRWTCMVGFVKER